jgi:membrane-associated phospholipid phosphatase
VYPALHLRQHQTPWLSTLMLVSYLAYYVSPLVCVLPQVLKRNWPLVRRTAAVFAGTLMATYVGYILIPATGPRFEGGFGSWLPAGGTLPGGEWWQRLLNDAEVIRWDAFPSGHVAIALVALVMALRHHRKVGLVYLPFVVGLCFATVFLGYHYVTDVLFGFVFAAFGLLVIEPAVKWWESIWDTNRPEQPDKA